MEERLRSILKRAHWSLALKSAAYGASWLVLPGWLFLLVALGIYLKPFFQPGKLARSFLVLLAISFGVHWLVPAVEPLFAGISYLFALYLGGLFFLLMGIRDLAFTHRLGRYMLLYAGLFLGVAVLAFWYAYPRLPLRLVTTSLLFVTAAALLFREFLGLMHDQLLLGVPGVGEAGTIKGERKRRRLFVWALTLLAFELFWVVGLLPVGFLMQAALLLLFVVLGTDVLWEHLKGTLTRLYVLRVVTVLIFVTLGIFAAFRWEL